MREPNGSLVEFISSCNGGGFWWDRRVGFWDRQMEPIFDGQHNGNGIMVEIDRDRGLLGNF